MKDTTVEDKIGELIHPKEETERQTMISILSALPGHISAPSISNVRPEPGPMEPLAWLSFSGPAYDPDKTFHPVDTLEEIEAAGWKTVPVSLCKWSNYRHSPCLGLVEKIPETQCGCFGSTDELNDITALCPLWIDPAQYGPGEARGFYHLEGLGTIKFSVKIGILVSVTAQRVEPRGTWYYKRGTARLNFPPDLHELFHDEQPVAQREGHSFATVDTEQGLSGALYWEPITHEQSAFPMSNAAMLAEIMRRAASA